MESRRACWAVIVLGLVTQAALIVWPPYVPLVDLPNHMARHVLEADWLAGRELPPFYDIECRIVPNLGADLVLPLLLQVLEPGVACKLFLVLAVALYWLGPAVYLRSVSNQPSSAWCASLLWLPLAFSSQFFWGFLNYYSGFGLAFLVLTHLVRLLTSSRARHWEWALHAVLVVLLFLWHLAPWGIYGVLGGSHLLAALWRRDVTAKKVAAFVAVCTPSLVLFALYTLDKSEAGPGETNWGTVMRKLYMPLTLFRGYRIAVDGIVIGTWFLAAAAFFVRRGMEHPGSQTSEVSKTSEVFAPAIGLVLLGILYVAVPFQLSGTSDTDSRLLPAMLVCALAIFVSRGAGRLNLGAALVALCLLVRQGDVFLAWQEHSRRLAIHAEAFTHLHEQARVLPLVLVPEQSKNYPEQHFPCWSVVTHRAYVPTLFAFRDQQPLILKGPKERVALQTAGAWIFDEPRLRRDYDFVWLYNPEGRPVIVPPSCVEVFSAEGLTLWRVQ